MSKPTNESYKISLMDLIDLSQGNPGALTVLLQIKDTDVLNRVTNALYRNQIVGPSIWIVYKDYCRSNINQFQEFDFDSWKQTRV